MDNTLEKKDLFVFNDKEGRNIVPKYWDVKELEISGKGGVFEATNSTFGKGVCTASGVQFDLRKCKFSELKLEYTSLINSKVQKCRFGKLHIEMDKGMPCIDFLRVTIGEFVFKGSTRKNLPFFTLTSSSIEHLILDSCLVADWSFNNCEIATLEIKDAKSISNFRFLGTKVHNIIIDGKTLSNQILDDSIVLLNCVNGELRLS